MMEMLSLGFPCGSAGKESTHNVQDLGSIPGSERSFGGEHGNPPQYSCLENPMNRLGQPWTAGARVVMGVRQCPGPRRQWVSLQLWVPALLRAQEAEVIWVL